MSSSTAADNVNAAIADVKQRTSLEANVPAANNTSQAQPGHLIPDLPALGTPPPDSMLKTNAILYVPQGSISVDDAIPHVAPQGTPSAVHVVSYCPPQGGVSADNTIPYVHQGKSPVAGNTLDETPSLITLAGSAIPYVFLGPATKGTSSSPCPQTTAPKESLQLTQQSGLVTKDIPYWVRTVTTNGSAFLKSGDGAAVFGDQGEDGAMPRLHKEFQSHTTRVINGLDGEAWPEHVTPEDLSTFWSERQQFEQFWARCIDKEKALQFSWGHGW